MLQSIRTWVYGLLTFHDMIVVIEKWRWPFIGMFDLPWGKIEHRESHSSALEREIEEEIGLNAWEYRIDTLFSVEEDFVFHTHDGVEKDEHLIAIVYSGTITRWEFDMQYRENGWDARAIRLIPWDDTILPKTNVLKQVLQKYSRWEKAITS